MMYVRNNPIIYGLIKQNHWSSLIRSKIICAYERILFNRYGDTLLVDNKTISLSLGSKVKLDNANANIRVWKVDHPDIRVSSDGELYYNQVTEPKSTIAFVNGYNESGELITSYKVTLVNWCTNASHLRIEGLLPPYSILGIIDDKVCFAEGKKLYTTGDAFKHRSYVGKLPIVPNNYSSVIDTPYGYLIWGNRSVYWSRDLKKWKLSKRMINNALRHMFDYWYDPPNGICYIYIGEYSCTLNIAHRVYRGTIINGEEPPNWETVLSFDSKTDTNNKNQNYYSARHIHNVSVDHETGILFVGTGDSDTESKILYSLDNGNTFNLLGTGSQKWRTLSIWSTAAYVYWNMDSALPQSIYRIKKELLMQGTYCATPLLSKGKTKIGHVYLVYASALGYFPVDAGEKYRETIERTLSLENQVRPIDTPDYDLSEQVAELANGSMWFHCKTKDQNGDCVTVMSTAPEGMLRDEHARVFGIKENSDLSVSIHELLLLKNPKKANISDSKWQFTQLEPILQDKYGVIYFRPRNLAYSGNIKATLTWTPSSEKNGLLKK